MESDPIGVPDTPEAAGEYDSMIQSATTSTVPRNRIHHPRLITRFAAVVTALAGAVPAFGAAAPAAFATPPPEPGRTGDTAPVVIHTVIAGGMPGGKIILIAAAAAALAAVAAVLPDRARATRRHMTVPGAQSVPPPPSAAAASPGQTSRPGHVVEVVVPKRQPRRRPAREGLTASREPEETPEWLI